MDVCSLCRSPLTLFSFLEWHRVASSVFPGEPVPAVWEKVPSVPRRISGSLYQVGCVNKYKPTDCLWNWESWIGLEKKQCEWGYMHFCSMCSKPEWFEQSAFNTCGSCCVYVTDVTSWNYSAAEGFLGIGFLVRWAGLQLPDSWSSEGVVAQHCLVLVMAAGNVQGYHHINLFCLSIPLTI